MQLPTAGNCDFAFDTNTVVPRRNRSQMIGCAESVLFFTSVDTDYPAAGAVYLRVPNFIAYQQEYRR